MTSLHPLIYYTLNILIPLHSLIPNLPIPLYPPYTSYIPLYPYIPYISISPYIPLYPYIPPIPLYPSYIPYIHISPYTPISPYTSISPLYLYIPSIYPYIPLYLYIPPISLYPYTPISPPYPPCDFTVYIGGRYNKFMANSPSSGGNVTPFHDNYPDYSIAVMRAQLGISLIMEDGI